MADYTSTDVYNYLSYLEHYLSGDLEVFHKICEESERQENKDGVPTPAVTSSKGSMYAEPHQNTPSSSTTSQTTMYAGDETSNYHSLRGERNDIFRLTIPITLTLFATVDCVGYLSGGNDDPLKTNENFKEFFKQSTIPVTEQDSVLLNQVFRQGLTHVYFPKLGVGISYHSTNAQKKLFFKNGNGTLILNVNELEKIVLSTFKRIMETESLYAKMTTRYITLIADYQIKLGNTITSYPA